MKFNSKLVALTLVCMLAVTLACPVVASAVSQKTSNLTSHSIAAGARKDYVPSGLSYITVTSSQPTEFVANFSKSVKHKFGYYYGNTGDELLSPSTTGTKVAQRAEVASGAVPSTVKLKHRIKNDESKSITVNSGYIKYYN